MTKYVLVLFATALIANASAQEIPLIEEPKYKISNVSFESHDGYAMFGKLVLPNVAAPRAIVIYVQNAEGTTVDMKRGKSSQDAFSYFDLYRAELTERSIGFFSYEGRGIRMGDEPPRFETIDWEVFNTSTLDNKVKDILSAIKTVRRQPGCETIPLVLMGSSEGTLLAAEAASRDPDSVAGLVLYSVLASNLRETFKYIVIHGAFMQHRELFDTNDDERISLAEFEADPKKVRDGLFKGVHFSVFDRNSDGFYTAEELGTQTKHLVDAVDNNNFEVLQAWAKVGAAVAVPENWFKDHFSHNSTWTFLSELNVPVGFFHGECDANTPISAVKAIEESSKSAGKTNMEFHYFKDVGHSLGVENYFSNATLPEGHQAIIAFVDRIIGNQEKAHSP
ncbi:MAG: hypothetical protein MI725_12740 [Pirellulales bacterium]|nr:hypothetical protein [Pirellulales bacterium]